MFLLQRLKVIPVINVIRNAEAVADFTIGLLYSETRNIARSHYELKKGKWIKDFPNYQYTKSVKDHIVGIVGLGNIGRLVAKQLSALGIRVIGTDPNVNEEELKKMGLRVPIVTLEEVFKSATVVSVHVRLTEETKGLIQEKHIQHMREDAFLINTSRAEVIEEGPLCKALLERRIAGAALDVFWHEPLPENHPLFLCENVTLTAHIAGDTVDSLPKSPFKLVEKLKASKQLKQFSLKAKVY
jgi:D-3-phosphoglycerate dehydrogenase / 2-oxoglutarate reductase